MPNVHILTKKQNPMSMLERAQHCLERAIKILATHSPLHSWSNDQPCCCLLIIIFPVLWSSNLLDMPWLVQGMVSSLLYWSIIFSTLSTSCIVSNLTPTQLDTSLPSSSNVHDNACSIICLKLHHCHEYWYLHKQEIWKCVKQFQIN